MRSRRTIIIALVAWVVALFFAGARFGARSIRRRPPPAPLQERFVDSRQRLQFLISAWRRSAASATNKMNGERLLRRRFLRNANQAAALRGLQPRGAEALEQVEIVTAGAQVLTVQCTALVFAAGELVARADGEVDVLGYFLVEQDVLHVARDARVAAGAELAEDSAHPRRCRASR